MSLGDPGLSELIDVIGKESHKSHKKKRDLGDPDLPALLEVIPPAKKKEKDKGKGVVSIEETPVVSSVHELWEATLGDGPALPPPKSEISEPEEAKSKRKSESEGCTISAYLRDLNAEIEEKEISEKRDNGKSGGTSSSSSSSVDESLWNREFGGNDVPVNNHNDIHLEDAAAKNNNETEMSRDTGLPLKTHENLNNNENCNDQISQKGVLPPTYYHQYHHRHPSEKQPPATIPEDKVLQVILFR